MSQLDIIVQGKMNRYFLGSASEEQFLEAENIISSSGIGSSLEKLDIFFSPMVIDGDNSVEIVFDRDSKYKGSVSDLFKDKKEYEEGDSIETEKIRYNSILTNSIQHAWSEDIDLEDKQSFLDSLEMNGASFSQRGWWIGDDVITNNTYENKLEEVNSEERLSLVEYGNFKVAYSLDNIEKFDFHSLIWNFDYGLYEERDNYFFSSVFYANNSKVYQLDEVIESLDQKQIIIERDWPIDG